MPPQSTATNEARSIAQEITSHDTRELKREYMNEGAYHFTVESGFHTETVSDEAADMLVNILMEDGLNGLEQFATDTSG